LRIIIRVNRFLKDKMDASSLPVFKSLVYIICMKNLMITIIPLFPFLLDQINYKWILILLNQV